MERRYTSTLSSEILISRGGGAMLRGVRASVRVAAHPRLWLRTPWSVTLVVYEYTICDHATWNTLQWVVYLLRRTTRRHSATANAVQYRK